VTDVVGLRLVNVRPQHMTDILLAIIAGVLFAGLSAIALSFEENKGVRAEYGGVLAMILIMSIVSAGIVYVFAYGVHWMLGYYFGI